MQFKRKQEETAMSILCFNLVSNNFFFQEAMLSVDDKDGELD